MADSVSIISDVSLEQLVEDLAYQVPDDQLVQFIKALDDKVAAWDFTEQVYKYFKKQHKILKAEVKND